MFMSRTPAAITPKRSASQFSPEVLSEGREENTIKATSLLDQVQPANHVPLSLMTCQGMATSMLYSRAGSPEKVEWAVVFPFDAIREDMTLRAA
jgi:hypothetical protein